MEDGAVEMAGVDVVEEILHRDGRVLLEEVDRESAERSFESDHGCVTCLRKVERKRVRIVNGRRLDVTFRGVPASDLQCSDPGRPDPGGS